MTQPKTASKFTPGALRAAKIILEGGHWNFDVCAEIIDRQTKAPEMYELLELAISQERELEHGVYEVVAKVAAEARRIKAAIDGEG